MHHFGTNQNEIPNIMNHKTLYNLKKFLKTFSYNFKALDRKIIFFTKSKGFMFKKSKDL